MPSSVWPLLKCLHQDCPRLASCCRFFGALTLFGAPLRSLARECSTLWVETRASLGHPLGVAAPSPEPQPEASTSAAATAEPRMLVLEIGSEELPPQDVVAAIQQVGARTVGLL